MLSKQKSCIACAQGKRRCDRQTPQCARCRRRGVECLYKDVTHLEPSRFSPLDVDLAFSLMEIPSPYGGSGIFPSLLYPQVVSLDRWSISQLLRSIKSYPRLFARHRRTPFIHARLYDDDLPEAIQDAFAVSVAYATKSAETEDMIFRILEAKTARLIQQHQDFDRISLSDLLAAVQSLLLFHIIQLFDGDIRQRVIAEQNADTLRQWTIQLQILADEQNHLLTPSTTTWHAWVFAESLRRTVILSILIDGLFSVLKMGYCTVVPALSLLPFTPEPGLWNACTDASWLDESSRHSSTVLYGDFSRAWGEGKIHDRLDSFHKLLLTPCMGEKHRHLLEMKD
ncbi:hypothetical protein ASPZODRAFT_69091 [Penicilliopsis zonata CBS 506.65]|uniref:Zn(2)-C6 fungal-type domain-containing protein n=1 Tax=Penicilliopsis zonata CBS 506.65 TaxID=1073090 RepID=A0A1L9SFN8_9EURO|nr:hypothetical protein ASPZODRAFT_69091 [Penicilliopsis zonata CBS 506.65]OJJ45928.1 hypothetical protein ASPZODRAFT_69091 [Penicilliopsis zonata CBS 506.65]